MDGVWGKVTKIEQDHENIQILRVSLDDSRAIKAIHYVYQGQKCEAGAEVLVNVSALDLGLGTGGYGFVMASYSKKLRSALSQPTYLGHVMKLRYSPFQTPVLAVEAEESESHQQFCSDFSLEGQPVFLGELHSMLPVLACLLHQWEEERSIVYIMDDQASLHLAISDHVRLLKQKLHLTTITFGQATGGDYEAVNLFSALETAKKIVQADDIIVTHGPGVIGTSTLRGFSGMQLVNWLHTVHTCRGRAIIVPRIQFRDHRSRHHGLSHHTFRPLAEHALVQAHIPFPILASASLNQTVAAQENSKNKKAGTAQEDNKNKKENKAGGSNFDELLLNQLALLKPKHALYPIEVDRFKKELEAALQEYGSPITTMGRGYSEEPYFFYAIGAAFQLYRDWLC